MIFKNGSFFRRDNRHAIGSWWWTLDKFSVVLFLCIIVFGIFVLFSASPAVAERIGLDGYHFIYKQLQILPLALLLCFLASLLNSQWIKYLGTLLGIGAFVGVLLTLIMGTEIKGATRWIRLAGLTLQPSEFLKPAFAIMGAWVLTLTTIPTILHRQFLSLALLGTVCLSLLLQPDLGMTILFVATWSAQLFLTGLALRWIVYLGGMGIAGLGLAYYTLPHVTSRVDRFLNPTESNSYQVLKSKEAFVAGGLFGEGPGEGQVKNYLPDSHADMIFAVAGEELGFISCVMIVLLFGLFITRSFLRLNGQKDTFTIIAGSGLLMQFGCQSFINMASALNLIPAKGMTLPFMSYGGSSLMALGLTVGFIFSFTRKRQHGNFFTLEADHLPTLKKKQNKTLDNLTQ
jgi:cell division protein FtsW